MVKMKFQSWLLLAVLAILVAFAAGIRQGIAVEKKNSKAVNLFEVADKKCGVQYLLPDTIASDSETISIKCDVQASDTATMFTKGGYVLVDVASSSASMKVWVKAPPELQLLLQNTIKLINPHE